MRSKKKRLKDCALYAILDNATSLRRPLTRLADAFARAGTDIVQLRDKCADTRTFLNEAQRVATILARSSTLFILNDHVELAGFLECDGVHLGQDDLPLPLARKLLGKKKIIGVSCHSLPQALKAQEEGADYLGIGPVFTTPTKPEYRPVGLELIRQVSKKITVPFFAIGGIDLCNVNEVRNAGGSGIAVCRALCTAKNIATTVSTFKTIV